MPPQRRMSADDGASPATRPVGALARRRGPCRAFCRAHDARAETPLKTCQEKSASAKTMVPRIPSPRSGPSQPHSTPDVLTMTTSCASPILSGICAESRLWVLDSFRMSVRCGSVLPRNAPARFERLERVGSSRSMSVSPMWRGACVSPRPAVAERQSPQVDERDARAPRDAATYQSFQHDITDAPSSAEGVWRNLRANIPERSGVWILDGPSGPRGADAPSPWRASIAALWARRPTTKWRS